VTIVKNSLTIVLPVHNAESQLRSNVLELLELAGELTDCFSVLIIDDGSNDDTFEVASELAAEFPQVSVRRHASRRGLGSALNAYRGTVNSDIVIVHDGVSPLDAGQLRCLWQKQSESRQGATVTLRNESIGDLANVSELQSALSRAHRRIVGLTLMPSLSINDSTGDNQSTVGDASVQRRPMHLPSDRVGRIPALPRPNFLKAITDFALGE
jgi:glycosyltransferase involved in cell wall biosynthesis